MSTSPFEIYVAWEGSNPLSGVLYNVPKGECKTRALAVKLKLGVAQSVEIVMPDASWLAVKEGQPLNGTPPFSTAVVVDTSLLVEGVKYEEQIVFRCGNETLAIKLLRVLVKPFEPEPLAVDSGSSKSILARFARDAYDWAGEVARATPEERQAEKEDQLEKVRTKMDEASETVEKGLTEVGDRTKNAYAGVTGKADEVAAHFGVENAKERAEQNAKKAAAESKKATGRFFRGAQRWLRDKSQELIDDTDDSDDTSE